MNLTSDAHIDARRQAGIDHFLTTYGLPACDDAYPVGFVYGDADSPYDYTVRVARNELANRLTGWLTFHDDTAPLFEAPNTLEDGIPIAHYSDAEGSRGCCIAEGEREISIGFDVFHAVGAFLSGYLESRPYPLDDAERIAQTPVLDVYEKMLLTCLAKAHEKAGIPLVRKAPWPCGRPFAVCLTHDVDEVKKTYQHLTRPVMYALRGEFIRAVRQLGYSIQDLACGRDPYWTFPELMRVEEELGVRSSLYFLEQEATGSPLSLRWWMLAARRYRFTDPAVAATIKKLDAGGWDVGIHGSYYSYRDKKLFQKEKQRLEDVLGHETSGTRQHHLNLELPGTWRIHAESGLAYDTSLGFKDQAGFRWGTCQPFHPIDSEKNQPLPIWELPLTIMDTPLFARQRNADELCTHLIDTAASVNGILTLLWHHTVYNNREYPHWTKRYQTIIKNAHTKNAWITHAADITHWWEKRNSIPLSIEIERDGIKVVCRPDTPLILLPIRKREVIKDGFSLVKEYGGAHVVAPRTETTTVKVT